LENIFGVVVFILFIVLRAMGDRKKGMSKKPPAVQKQTGPMRAPAKKQQPAAKTKTAAKPAAYGAIKAAPAPTPAPAVRPFGIRVPDEGKSVYENIPYMEGYERPPGEMGEQEGALSDADGVADQIRRYSLKPTDLRQAVVWSEILARPRFKQKQIR